MVVTLLHFVKTLKIAFWNNKNYWSYNNIGIKKKNNFFVDTFAKICHIYFLNELMIFCLFIHGTK